MKKDLIECNRNLIDCNRDLIDRKLLQICTRLNVISIKLEVDAGS